jgi:hypothetical protein
MGRSGGWWRAALCLLCLWVLSAGRSGAAGSEERGRYSYDDERLFWFLVASGPHIGEDLIGGTQDTEYLDWITGPGFQMIEPEFLVLAGDLVDATNGALIPDGQHEEEWRTYRRIVLGNGMDPEVLYDLPGVHDQYGDPGFTHYLEWSIQGRRRGAPYFAWSVEKPFGSYRFVGLCTPVGDGLGWPFDNAGFDLAQLRFLEEELRLHGDAAMLFTFGYHPRTALGTGREGFLDLLERYGVALYAHGGVMEPECSYAGGGPTLHLGLPPLGRPLGGKLAIVAVDNDVLTYAVEDVDDAPYVLLTAPVPRGSCGVNPHAYRVPRNNAENPIRVLVFDEPGVEPRVYYRVDEEGFAPMDPVPGRPHLFEAFWDARSYGYGEHELTVKAVGSHSQTRSWTIVLRDTQCSDGIDNDGDGLVDFEDPGCADALDDEERDPGGGLELALRLNRTSFQAGDRFLLELELENRGEAVAGELYVVLSAWGMHYYFPDWRPVPGGVPEVIPAWSGQTRVLLDFVFPAVSGSGAGLTFYAAFVDPGGLELRSNVAEVGFSYY